MVEINEIKMKKTKTNINESKSWYFERLMRLINFWLNQRKEMIKGDIMIDMEEIQRIIKTCFKKSILNQAGK